LIDWQSEIPSLPFIPDEGGVLKSIIDTAQQFRQFVSSYTQNSIGLTMAECATMRFYLRKIEGAEILLAFETNFFRQELHKWSPIAPEPPPNIMSSASTRKPRPTKQQKLIAQLGLKSAEELPPQFRTKAHVFRKKSVEASGMYPNEAQRRPLQPVLGLQK
jgi:histone demethylase JARID1